MGESGEDIQLSPVLRKLIPYGLLNIEPRKIKYMEFIRTEIKKMFRKVNLS